MTRKDFEAIAGAVKDAHAAVSYPPTPATTRVFGSMARSIADVYAGLAANGVALHDAHRT